MRPPYNALGTAEVGEIVEELLIDSIQPLGYDRLPDHEQGVEGKDFPPNFARHGDVAPARGDVLVAAVVD